MDHPKETSAAHLTTVLQRGLSWHQQGDLDQAARNYQQILAITPHHAEALHLLGVVSNQKQDNTAAIELIGQAVQVVPDQPIYHTSLGNALRDSDRLEEAINSYQKALQLKPDLVETHINMGIAFHQLVNYEQAASCYQHAINLKPDSAEAYYNLGNTYKEQRRYDEAIDSYRQGLRINPKFSEAHYNLAIVLEKQGRYDDAIECLNQCLCIHPLWAEVHNNLGNLLKNKGLRDQALAHFQKAVQLKPILHAAHNNMGNALKDQGCYIEAMACYQKALQVYPQYAEGHLNLGVSLAESGHPAAAVDHFREAIRINPEFAEAYNYMGLTLADMGKREAAIECFEKAIEHNRACSEAYSYLIYQLQYVCDWQRLQTYLQSFDRLNDQRQASGISIIAEPPFIQMARQADPLQQLNNARLWCHKIAQPFQDLKRTFSFDGRRRKSGKLTVGYLSADFHDHATAHLMQSVFGLHNRENFKIYCYSYGPDDHSSYRQQIKLYSDRFINIRRMSYSDAAQRIYADQVDILVDLKGHTKGARLGILACRPAPIQVHYLGYPGTTGADFVDYLITDRVVTPPEHAPFYSEQLVFLPHSYQVNDHQQAIADCVWPRKDAGLPEKGVVFSSFNLPYKIDSRTLDCWTRILHQVPGSVLWLFNGGQTATKHLAKEAGRRGIDPARLVFADKLPKAEHLARLQLADLALDTRIVNGHTTTSDALWAGVPVITVLGDHFATRVSASLLHAIGLSELIVDHMDAYVQLAVRLALDLTELQRIKDQLSQNRLTTPLFNTPGFVGHLEIAYQKMWSTFKEGQHPQQIEVVVD